MPKANTRDFAARNSSPRSYCEFNGLHAPAGLALRMPIQMAGILARFKPGPQVQFSDEEIPMFDGKNNRLLDSFSFRAALITAVLALWSGAGYMLIALA
jgi:hypothetical protein